MGFDPVTMTIGATVLSGVGSIGQGVAGYRQGQIESNQYEENARLAKLQGDEQEVARREDLMSTLSSIRAIRTSRGLDVTSPTAMAIDQRITTEAERGISADRLNALNQAASYRSAAQIARSQGRSALLGGFLKAGTSLGGSGLLDRKAG